MQIFDVVILLESRIIPQWLMMQIICICDLLMYKFSVVLAYWHFHGFDYAFCTIHKNHAHNILHHQKVPSEYVLVFFMRLIWWSYYHQLHSKRFRSCNFVSTRSPMSRKFFFLVKNQVGCFRIYLVFSDMSKMLHLDKEFCSVHVM